MRANRLIAVLLGSCLAAAAVSAQTTGTLPSHETAKTLPAYRAVYEAYYGGRRVGVSEFSVVRIAESANAYEFRSVSRLAGLYRLLAPGAVEEVSAFVYEGGRVRPLSYSLSGSRRGNDDFSIAFDWEQGIATTVVEDVSATTELVPGIFDRSSLQVVLMLRGENDGPRDFMLLDRDGLETHEVRADGEETLETPLGRLPTRKSIQQRLNSSRRTLIWSAPNLHGLPVRIERQNRGETRTALQLQSVEWLEPTDR